METVKFKKFEKDLVWFEIPTKKILFPVPVIAVDVIEKEESLDKYEFYFDKYIEGYKEVY